MMKYEIDIVYFIYLLILAISSVISSLLLVLIYTLLIKVSGNLSISYFSILSTYLIHFIFVRKFYSIYSKMIHKSSEMKLELEKVDYNFSKFSQKYGLIVNLILYMFLNYPLFFLGDQSKKNDIQDMQYVLFLINIIYFVIQFRLILVFYNLKKE